MTDDVEPISDEGCAATLVELLVSVPETANLQWQDEGGLRAWHSGPVGRYCHEAASRLTAEQEAREAAERQRDEALEALRPFAVIAGIIETSFPKAPGSMAIWSRSSNVESERREITLGDLRQARAILSRLDEKE